MKKTNTIKLGRSLPLYTAILSGILLLQACNKKETITTAGSGNVRTDHQNLTQASGSSDEPYANGRFLIEPANGKTLDDVIAEVKAEGGTIVRVQSELGFLVAASQSGDFKTNMLKRTGIGTVTTSFNFKFRGKETSVAYKSGMVIPKSHITNTNPFFPLQWSHTAINSHDAWRLGHKGFGAVVAIIDGGFYPNHPDIVNNVDIANSRNFVAGETLETNGGFPHGTHVAGIIAAEDNEIGVIGVAPKAKLVLIKGLGDEGWGSFEDLVAGIVYAANLNVDILNMSLGGVVAKTSKDPNYGLTNEIRAFINFVNKAVKYAEQKGVTVIVSAGNDGVNLFQYGYLNSPCGAPGVVGVSALGPIGWYNTPSNSLDAFAFYSNYGTNTVDISGSGGNLDLNFPQDWYYDMVLSCFGPSEYSWMAGTSMSCPQVSGVAALIVGKYGKMSPAQLKAKLFKSTDDLGKPGRDEYFGHGRVNAFKAVN